MRKALVPALLAVAALTACDREQEQMGLTNWQKAPPLLAGVDEGASPETGGQTGPNGGPPNPGGATLAPAAQPGTVPVRRAGLWQTTVNSGRGDPQTGQLCVDEQSELRRGPFVPAGGGRGGQGCEPKIAKAADGSWTSTVSCTRNMGDATMKLSSSQTLTGDLSSRYQVKGTSTTSGAPNEDMNGTRQISATGVYQGPCPAGMSPGDFKGPDGQVRNVLQQGQGRGPGGFPGGPGNGRS